MAAVTSPATVSLVAAGVLQRVAVLGAAADGACEVDDGHAYLYLQPRASLSPALEAFLDRDAAARMASRVSWKYMDACFKWRLIQEYLRCKGVLDDDPVVAQLRALLSRKMLGGVEYDTAARRVVRLNHADL